MASARPHYSSDGPIMTLIKGVLVGTANIIPGVSGGTFALILGIFDRIVHSLNNIGPGTLGVVMRLILSGFKAERRREFAAEWKKIDAWFLITLIVGAGIAILSFSFLINWLLSEHSMITLAFFIGLILPSVAVPWAMMDRRGPELLFILPGLALTIAVSVLMPQSGAASDNLLWVGFVGALAICAMILPGISGSFVMLVLGQYQNALLHLTTLQRDLTRGHFNFDAFIWLACLALGMIIGILAFARLLDFMLRRFKSATMAFLIGLLLGSLWALWPYKDLEAGASITGRKGDVKHELRIATAPNRMPATAVEGFAGGGALVAGLVCSAGLIALGKKKPNQK